MSADIISAASPPPACWAIAAIWASAPATAGTAGAVERPKTLPQTIRIMLSITPQMANCTKPTRATPIILPIISWKGFTLDTISSTMRLVFSSITLCITMPP